MKLSGVLRLGPERVGPSPADAHRLQHILLSGCVN